MNSANHRRPTEADTDPNPGDFHGRAATSLGRTATDEPRLDGARILQNFVFQLAELGLEDYPLDVRAQRLVARLGALLLDQRDNRLAELQSIVCVTHGPCPPVHLDEVLPS